LAVERLIPIAILAIALSAGGPRAASAAGNEPPSAQEAEHDQAVDDAIAEDAPATPDGILHAVAVLTGQLKAAQNPYGKPTVTNSAATLNIAPGAAGTDIHLAAGYPTTINFIDSSGQPWPVAAATAGLGAKTFSVEILPSKENGNMVQITPLKPFPMRSGLSVVLRQLPKPLIFNLVTGEANIVNASFDARLPKIGPNGQAPIIDRPTAFTANDPTLMSILQGLPPDGAHRLDITGLPDSDFATAAWTYNGAIYLRTTLPLLSPEQDGVIRSPEGMAAYQLPDTPRSRVIVLSDGGTPKKVHLDLITAPSSVSARHGG
jgi:intracellular multiplication protein IcmK